VLAWTIEEWPLREQPDSLLAELYAVPGQLHAEATPGIPVEKPRTLLGARQNRARAVQC